MEKTLKRFGYGGKDVRVVSIKDEPWFIGKDVCEILEIKNPTDAVKRLDDDEVTRFNLGGLSGEVILLNESGLYSLVLGSKKPEAKTFKRWITHEVIPSIRKHGAYMTEGTLEKALTSPDFLIQLATKLKEEQEARSLAEEQLIIQQPKVQAHDRFISADNYQLIREAGKSLGIGEKKLYAFLRGTKLLNYKNEPYQPYVNDGYFVVKQRTFGNTSLFNVPITYVTAKGLDHIDKLVERNGGARRINSMTLAQIDHCFGRTAIDIS
ncbi:phage repressor protein/antirepressor Ant [Brevibacillus laterosporus]|nr:phage antirepressor [Brevibacillus laterosporus]TPG77716.1 phage repressor protein/antirepressor Ant [Brevibacillus laterosporus]